MSSVLLEVVPSAEQLCFVNEGSAVKAQDRAAGSTLCVKAVTGSKPEEIDRLLNGGLRARTWPLLTTIYIFLNFLDLLWQQ